MGKLPINIKIFLVVIYVFTVVTFFVFYKLGYLSIQPINYVKILFFSLLMGLTESSTVYFRNMSFSTSFAIQLASFILFGPIVTMFIIIIGFSLRVMKANNMYKHIFNTPWYGTLSNYCMLLLPILFGNYVYIVSGGVFPLDNITPFVTQLTTFSFIAFLINTLLISILYSVSTRKNIIYSFISNVRLVFMNILIMVPFGIMLAFIFKYYNYGGVLLILFPIVLARYTFSLYIDSKSQYVQTVDSLMRAMEARDKYTEGHSQRVAKIATMIGRELKYSDTKIEQLNIASLLHDVGKIGVDDSILNKPGKLTETEYEAIKKHPEIGYNILKDVKNLGKVLHAVRHHHEKYDGSGYPDGKNAEELPLDVFIIQLADSIDAMATDRPYRNAMTQEQIIEEVKKYSGTQFHPKVVEAYLNILRKQKEAV